MKSVKIKRTLSLLLCILMIGACILPTLASCKKKSKKDSIVIMAEEFSGLFNPFYATSGSDMDVVGMTQIGMLSTDSNGNTVAGDGESTVVKDFDISADGKVYTFVIKNGLKFSDQKPLTMNDVLFNMYMYLDPVYTGSSTMYSIKIQGLTQYRTQTNLSGDAASTQEDQIAAQANAFAKLRLQELIDLYQNEGKKNTGSDSAYKMTDAQMIAAINALPDVSVGYKNAVATAKQQSEWTIENYRALLLEDYELVKKTFKEELQNDFKAAKESFDITTAPYNEHAKKLESDIFKFFLYEGVIKPEYEKINGKNNLQKIVKFDNEGAVESFPTEEAAINKVYTDKMQDEFHNVLRFWGTAGTLTTQFTGAARDVILHNNMKDGQLIYPNISGIVSLGHTGNVPSVTVKGTTYTVAKEHNADGTPKNANEYDVLQITLDAADPKAIYNFGFTVAPQHYYAADANGNAPVVDIANNKFGLEYASSTFQTKVIQSPVHAGVPVGAGPFVATNDANADNPTEAEFCKNNVVYYKANPYFMDSDTNPNSIFKVKAAKLRFQVVSSTNALDKLVSGEVDYITPQFTKANSDRLKELAKKGFVQLDSWQLGYGYIGINAGEVPNINLRRAIMSAMQTELALSYYEAGTCKTIDWPMSRVSWAYPYEANGETSKANGKEYMNWTSVAAAKEKIQKYMNLAGVSAGSSELKIKFTIAGSSITEHPTYTVFKQAAELLNEMGWDVEVKADAQALTKLSTGSLAVWAAAWGSTIDPDMYQVYHKNSTATSVKAWGYDDILSKQSQYPEEYQIITKLSGLIDDGRSTLDQAQRRAIYEDAMGYVLDLAVEMPCYQRKVLYAYNSKTITGLTTNVNPYSSPLESIWNLELVKK